MYCSSCGYEVAADHRYCPKCGRLVEGGPDLTGPGAAAPRLSRPMDTKKIAGVCAGIARYLRVDVTLIRIIVLLLSVYPPGLGLIFYVVCWIVMPRDVWALPSAAITDGDVAKAAG